MNQKVVVTGGAGFIGSHLVDALLAEGCQVVIVDTLVGRGRELVNPVATLQVVDVRETQGLTDAFAGAICVFHLAALARVPRSFQEAALTHDVNATGTLSVLLAAHAAGVRRVVFASSSSVYGDAAVLPAHEGLAPNPLSPYAAQKRMGEDYCRIWHEQFGVETAALRFFNVYGPRFDPKGEDALVIGKFIAQRREGKPMTICGDGQQARDFTYVSDVVRACIAAMRAPLHESLLCNIGAGNPTSVNDIAKLIGGPTVTLPARPGEPRRTHADISKARALLEWEPEVPVNRGIAELKRACGLR